MVAGLTHPFTGDFPRLNLLSRLKYSNFTPFFGLDFFILLIFLSGRFSPYSEINIIKNPFLVPLLWVYFNVLCES